MIQKTKEIVALTIGALLCVVKLKRASKWLEGQDIKKPMMHFAKSKDVNIRGLSILCLAKVTPEDYKDDVGLDFDTTDIDLLLATYVAYKSEGQAMGSFLAKTNFPELCVQELRNHAGNEETFQVNQAQSHMHVC